MTFDGLAMWLNQNDFATTYGRPYRGGRGAARVAHAAYAYVRDELGLGDAGASPIAEAFTDKNGAYAWSRDLYQVLKSTTHGA